MWRIGSLSSFNQNRGEPLNAPQTSTRVAPASQIQTMSLREYAKNRTLHNAVRATLTGQLNGFSESGTDFNAPEKRSGYSPLQIALEIVLKKPDSLGAQVMVRALVKRGADLDAATPQTILHTAVEKQSLAAVSMLLDLGAKKLLKNSHGETPLDLALKLANSADPREANIGAAMAALLDPLPAYTEAIENHLALNPQFA